MSPVAANSMVPPVGGDEDVEVGGDEDVEVGGDEDVEVGGDEDVEVGGDEDVEVGAVSTSSCGWFLGFPAEECVRFADVAPRGVTENEAHGPKASEGRGYVEAQVPLHRPRHDRQGPARRAGLVPPPDRPLSPRVARRPQDLRTIRAPATGPRVEEQRRPGDRLPLWKLRDVEPEVRERAVVVDPKRLRPSGC